MPPCLLLDCLWEHFAEEASEALESGAEAKAGALWRTGGTLTEGFDASDPRRAASLHCLAAATRTADDFAEAETIYRKALAAWECVPEWISNMQIEFTARSASMHIRLEIKRRDELLALKRHINNTLAEGGLAATLNDLAELLHATAREGEAEPLYQRALDLRAKALGHREEGVGWICDNLADLLEDIGRPDEGNEPRARARRIEADPFRVGHAGFRAQTWIKMTDIRKLTAAVYLTPVRRRATPTS